MIATIRYPGWTARTLLVAAAFTLSALSSASALPPGRAWTPVDRYVVPGHTWFVSDWLNTDTEGTPIVFGEAVGGIGRDVAALRWADSSWAVTWKGGFATSFSWPILSPPGTYYLLWKGIQGYETPTGSQVDLVMARFFGDHIGELDTLGRFYAGNWVYSAAVASTRRWVVVSDRGNLRLFHADSLRVWNEVEVEGSGDRGAATAPMNDSTALVAWAGLGEGLRWGILSGRRWADGPLLDGQYSLAGVPVLRPRPSGGFWLAWGTGADEHLNHLPIRTFHDGQWSAPERIPCARQPAAYWSSAPDLSRDAGEYPAVVWSAIDATGRETICACMPTDSGFTVADNLPYAGRATVARDRDGDLWVAWWDMFAGMFWLHTYTRATAEEVRIEGHGRNRRLAWTLSEPAPETWWAVLRARGSGDFEPVARVRAGSHPAMSWTDSSPPAGVLRYRIRRESVDTRYRRESQEVRWPEARSRPRIRLAVSLPLVSDGRLEAADAAPGPMEIRLYDLQGRVVLAQQAIMGASGRDTVPFNIASASVPLPNGIYFAAVRDAGGRMSDAVKVVILR